jgi:hypothetical protein
MTATVNASTSAGVIVTSDTSGALALQTAGTTALTISSGQIVNFVNTPTAGGVSLLTGVTASSLPTGSVIQVVTGSTATAVSTGGTTFVTSGLSATITPQFSASKILIIISQQIFATNLQGQASLRIVRGSTALNPTYDYASWGQASQNMINISIQAYDSPSTTSATTYTSQIRLWSGTGSVFAQYGDGGGQASSFITLMEIR